jgi:hypothetical protein
MIEKEEGDFINSKLSLLKILVLLEILIKDQNSSKL